VNPPLDPAEYRKLIELAYLGEWLINSHHDNDFQDEAATATVQRLLAGARDMDVDDVDQDAETNNYYLMPEWVDRLYDRYILDYDDHVFWDELTERLAQRDLARERGVSMDEISRDEDVAQLRPIEERYRRELEEHGVERLELGSDF